MPALRDAARSTAFPRLCSALSGGTVVGLMHGGWEAGRSWAPGGFSPALLHVATYLVPAIAACVSLHVVLTATWILRRQASWLAPGLTAALAAGATVFLRTHVAEDMVTVPWLDVSRASMAVRAGLVGLGVLALWSTAAWWIRRRPVAATIRRIAGSWTAFLTSLALLLVSLSVLVPAVRDLHEPRLPPASDEPDLPCNVVFITIDTLRSDHLSQYGYGRDTGAGLDRFGFATFERTHATANWTKASTCSMLTGLYPSTHGAHGRHSVLPPEARTLTEVLAERGATTAYLTSNLNASGLFGLDQGAHVTLGDPRRAPNPWLGTTLGDLLSAHTRLVNAADLTPYATSYLRSVQSPFFLYLHYNDPHTPYRPPRALLDRYSGDYHGRAVERPRRRMTITAAEQEHMEARYDAEIAAAIEGIVAILTLLEQQGRLDDTLVLITSDHGEEFRDHGGWTHAETSYEEMLRVPLLVKPPGGSRSPSRVTFPARHIDLMPTVLDYIGATIPEHLPGRSLRPDLEGREVSAPANAVLLSESHMSGTWSYSEGRFKLIVKEREDGEGDVLELYDLEVDPGERHDLSDVDEHEALLRRLYRDGVELRESLRRHSLPAVDRALDAELEAELEALGYIR